eukprot:scaffold265945_cov36-Prasinocladus_malaysianus.AAC.1
MREVPVCPCATGENSARGWFGLQTSDFRPAVLVLADGLDGMPGARCQVRGPAGYSGHRVGMVRVVLVIAKCQRYLVKNGVLVRIRSGRMENPTRVLRATDKHEYEYSYELDIPLGIVTVLIP